MHASVFAFHRRCEEFVRSLTPDAIRRFNLNGVYDYGSQLLVNEKGALKT